jgi:hypothetical protein
MVMTASFAFLSLPASTSERSRTTEALKLNAKLRPSTAAGSKSSQVDHISSRQWFKTALAGKAEATVTPIGMSRFGASHGQYWPKGDPCRAAARSASSGGFSLALGLLTALA